MYKSGIASGHAVNMITKLYAERFTKTKITLLLQKYPEKTLRYLNYQHRQDDLKY